MPEKGSEADAPKEFVNMSANDSGRKPESFYRKNMDPIRYKIRHALLGQVNRESPTLGRMQKTLRCKALDYYFLYTANLGAHMFYVLMCPLPGWFGYMNVLRDSVLVLGLGIYFTGCVKDYLCLPRPQSPPLHRLTLSGYTAQEYGCPSSHTANATSMCLLILQIAFQHWEENSGLFNLVIVLITAFYFFTMILGRLYCGMHGCVDICVGFIVGSAVFYLRAFLLHDWWDDLILHNNSYWVPIGFTALYYAMVYVHSVPLDPCPCFQDSVSFMGVLMGLDGLHWYVSNYTADLTPAGFEPGDVPFQYSQLGLLKTLLRIVVGVSIIVTWKIVSKPVLLRILSPVAKLLGQSRAPDDYPYALKSRTDLEIIVRLIVYAGIPASVVLDKFVFGWLGLGPGALQI